VEEQTGQPQKRRPIHLTGNDAKRKSLAKERMALRLDQKDVQTRMDACYVKASLRNGRGGGIRSNLRSAGDCPKWFWELGPVEVNLSLDCSMARQSDPMQMEKSRPNPRYFS
jgi:hypothetical protein